MRNKLFVAVVTKYYEFNSFQSLKKNCKTIKFKKTYANLEIL